MSERKEFLVKKEEEGSRLDQFLVEKIASVSRTWIKKLIEDKKVLVNNQPTKAHHKVRYRERIEVEESPPKTIDLIPEKKDLEIIYEDDEILVINKPAGLLVHPAGKRTTGTLANILAFYFGQLPSLGDRKRLGIVHRLDEGTSGIMVIAKTEDSLRNISEQFEKREVKKEYLALVKGRMELDEGRIDFPLGRHQLKRQRMAVRYTVSRAAETYWKVIERFKYSTLVALTPKTGRTHQLRVHLAHLGHPILGDKEYGIKAKIDHQALCAYYLGFRHPKTHKFIEFKIELPNDFKKLIDGERLK